MWNWNEYIPVRLNKSELESKLVFFEDLEGQPNWRDDLTEGTV